MNELIVLKGKGFSRKAAKTQRMKKKVDAVDELCVLSDQRA
jgi:hypothetical protein